MSGKDAGVVLRSVGLLLPMVAIMAVLSFPVAAAFGEYHFFLPLGLTALLALGLGLLLYLPLRQAGEAQLKHGLVVAAVGWLWVSALGALPFVLAPLGPGFPLRDPANAFFEAMSGFTGTGLTMVERPDLLPRTLQWWRSFTQWVGGMGVIVLMLTLLVGPGRSAVSLYYAEARAERIHPSVLSTVRTMWWIFLLYTVVSALALWVVGVPMWEAVNHAMTAVATGGFSLHPQSIGAYRSLAVEVVILLTMIAGATSFVVHYQFMRHGVRAWAKDAQTRWLWGALIGGVGVVGGVFVGGGGVGGVWGFVFVGGNRSVSDGRVSMGFGPHVHRISNHGAGLLVRCAQAVVGGGHGGGGSHGVHGRGDQDAADFVVGAGGGVAAQAAGAASRGVGPPPRGGGGHAGVGRLPPHRRGGLAFFFVGVLFAGRNPAVWVFCAFGAAARRVV